MNPDTQPVPPIDRQRLERERRTDPLRYGLLPHEGLHLLWARVQAEPADEPWYRRLWPATARLAVPGAAAAALVLAVAIGLTTGPELPGAARENVPAAPSVVSDFATDGKAGGLGAESVDDRSPACVPVSSPDLATHDFALDGTVIATDDGSATFLVHQDFINAAGYMTERTTVRLAPGMHFEPGQRYLVAGDRGLADTCLSQPWSETLARQWANSSR